MTWLTFWLIILGTSIGSFVLMMILIGSGAIKELKMTLEELREDTEESKTHPEILDEAT